MYVFIRENTLCTGTVPFCSDISESNISYELLGLIFFLLGKLGITQEKSMKHIILVYLSVCPCIFPFLFLSFLAHSYSPLQVAFRQVPMPMLSRKKYFQIFPGTKYIAQHTRERAVSCGGKIYVSFWFRLASSTNYIIHLGLSRRIDLACSQNHRNTEWPRWEGTYGGHLV